LAEGRRQALAPRVPYVGRKICEQSQGDGTSSLYPISGLFSFAHSILISLKQWKIEFQPRIKLNDNIHIYAYKTLWFPEVMTYTHSIDSSRFLVQGSISHLGSKEHNIRLLPTMQQNCSRIIKWYIQRNSSKKFNISFFSFSRLSHLLVKLKNAADVSYSLFKVTKILYADPDRVFLTVSNTLVSLLALGA